MDNKQLQNRIEALEKQLKDLQTSSTIPLTLVKSLESLGFLKTIEANLPEGWETHLTPYSTFRLDRGNAIAPLWIPLYVYDESF